MNGPEFESDESSQEQEKEPTSQELAEACKEVLSPEDCEELAQMDFDEAISFAFTLLLEAGEDPEEFLTQKGILERE